MNKRAGERHAGKFRPSAEKLRVEDLKRLVVLDHELNDRRSKKRVGRCFAHLEEFFRHVPVIDVPRRMTEYIAHRKAEGAAASTIRNEKNALGRGFTLACRDGLLSDRPVLPTVRVTAVRTGFVDDETMAKVLRALPDHMRAFSEF